MSFWNPKPNIITDPEKVRETLTRGVAEILPTQDDLFKLLTSGKRIKLYQGFDPTAKSLHVGNMIGLRKLKHFQDLGHEVIFLIGDGTGQAGDPSGKKKARDTFFTQKELLENASSYKKQVGNILKFSGKNPAKMLFNGDWLNKLTLTEVLDIANNFTLQQILDRDLFQERIKKGEAVNLREFLYPLLQGYDSVEMEVDLEIGGSDQTFNMLAGRVLAKKMINKEKFVLATPLLVDGNGEKVGKSEGNAMWLSDTPEDMFGKIMSLGDDFISTGFELLTDVPMNEVKKIQEKIKTENPKQYKERLAFEIVSQVHGESAADKAKKNFSSVFSNKEIPEDIHEATPGLDETIEDVLVKEGVVPSKSEIRRLVEAGGLRDAETGEKIKDVKKTPHKTIVLKVGKKKFIKIHITPKKK